MKRTTFATVLAAGLISSVCGLFPAPAQADPGDPAGWFLNVDPRHRAFLTFTQEAGGPRLLMLACLRDAQTFTTLSVAVGPKELAKKAMLRLSSGSTVFEAEGEITTYLERSAFISDADADDAAMRTIGLRLLPVLGGSGDLTLAIGPVGAPTARAVIRRDGLAKVLPRFTEVCFR